MRMLWMVLGTCLMWAGLARAEEKAERPEWDQHEAERLVRAAVRMEQTQGQPWDKIPWMTDVDAAIARARRLDKPIFLFFYVDEGGPAAAPC